MCRVSTHNWGCPLTIPCLLWYVHIYICRHTDNHIQTCTDIWKILKFEATLKLWNILHYRKKEKVKNLAPYVNKSVLCLCLHSPLWMELKKGEDHIEHSNKSLKWKQYNKTQRNNTQISSFKVLSLISPSNN